MKTENIKHIILIGAIVLALVTIGVFFAHNRSLKKNLTKERLSSEALLSEKLLLDKSIEKINVELMDVKSRNTQLGSRLEEKAREIDEKMAEMRKLMNENSTLRGFRSKARELEALTTKLNESISELNGMLENERLQFASEKQLLNDKVSALQKENGQLYATNTILSAMAGNNHRVEALRGKNDRLTVRARRTHKLVFSFELPATIGDNIEFKLNCPEGKVFDSKDNQHASIQVINNNRNFYASISDIPAVETKTIEMVYLPEEKLTKGNYEFQVYNNGRYIGSSKFRLR